MKKNIKIVLIACAFIIAPKLYASEKPRAQVAQPSIMCQFKCSAMLALSAQVMHNHSWNGAPQITRNPLSDVVKCFDACPRKSNNK